MSGKELDLLQGGGWKRPDQIGLRRQAGPTGRIHQIEPNARIRRDVR
jgi:hypothetical protein